MSHRQMYLCKDFLKTSLQRYICLFPCFNEICNNNNVPKNQANYLLSI